MAKRTAVIDIGSNSVRMVIYEKSSRFAFHILQEVKSRVRISEATYENGGNLQEEPSKRAFLALKDFVSIIKSYKAQKTLCVATSALRDAPNAKTFTKKVAKELGLHIKVIDGKREALLGGIAAANLLPLKERYVTVDIGGGSTEFALIENKKVLDTFSLNVGTVRLKELFYDTKENNEDDKRAFLTQVLNTLPKQFYCDNIIGVGGTIRSITKSILKQDPFYPIEKLHAYEYKVSEHQEFIESLLEIDSKHLKSLQIKKERFDIIKPGTYIFLSILKRFDAQKVMTSGVGVREGLFLTDLLRSSNNSFPANFNPSVKNLLDKHSQKTSYCNNLAKTSQTLFKLLASFCQIDSHYQKPLHIASKLLNIGTGLHYYYAHDHSAYMIFNGLEYGFSHEEIVLIATLVRFSKKKLPSATYIKKYQKLLPKEPQLIALCSLIALSRALLSHKPKEINFSFSFENECLIIHSTESLYLAKENVLALEHNLPFKLKFV